MAQRNDDELASYLAALLNPFGQISDQERLWYLTELNIAQPYLGAAQMNDLWMAYWISKGIPQGSVNDMAYNWLLSLGIPAGHINDMWHTYFEVPAYPPILDTTLVWLDETTLVTSGSDVIGWTNKGSGGALYDLDVIAGSPQIGLINGLNSPSFALLDSLRPTVDTLINRPLTIMALFQIDSISAGGTLNTLFDNGPSGTSTPRMQFFHRKGSGTFENWNFVYPNGIATPVNSSDTIVHGLQAKEDPGSSGMRLNLSGEAIVTNTGTGGDGFVYATLGNEYVNADRGFLGRLNSFYVWDFELSTQELSDMRVYIASRGGITW